MFGTYQVPFTLQCGETSIQVTVDKNLCHYTRRSPDEDIDLKILGAPDFLVQPTEPIQTPKPVGAALMLSLEKEFVVPPKADETVFLTFPVEIGIFVKTKSATELLDVFSLVPSKFTLYGKPAGGHICRYWQSSVFMEIPATEPMKTGAVRLEIKNTSDKWITIDQVVINAYDMKIYFREDFCSISARMKILGQRIAQVECESVPLESSMTQSVEVFESGMINVISKKFLMEEGL